MTKSKHGIHLGVFLNSQKLPSIGLRLGHLSPILRNATKGRLEYSIDKARISFMDIQSAPSVPADVVSSSVK